VTLLEKLWRRRVVREESGDRALVVAVESRDGPIGHFCGIGHLLRF
jgi:hypothetical protein